MLWMSPPCSPQSCPPLQLSLLTALLLSNWKGLIQPPCPWCCQALASLQGASALPPGLPHTPMPTLGCGSSFLQLLPLAFILLPPRRQ